MFFFPFFSVLTLFRSIPLPCVSGILLGAWVVFEKGKNEAGAA